jgi:hypothetical protein
MSLTMHERVGGKGSAVVVHKRMQAGMGSENGDAHMLEQIDAMIANRARRNSMRLPRSYRFITRLQERGGSSRVELGVVVK